MLAVEAVYSVTCASPAGGGTLSVKKAVPSVSLYRAEQPAGWKSASPATGYAPDHPGRMALGPNTTSIVPPSALWMNCWHSLSEVTGA